MAHTPKQAEVPPAMDLRVALVTSEFNEIVTGPMREAALKELARLQCSVAVDAWAPGVYDIPLIGDTVLLRTDVDALVAIGAVITGETKHDEIVTHAAARALTDLALRHRKPVGLGITGPGQNQAQALARIDRAVFAVRSVVKQSRTIASVSAPDAGTR